MRRMSPDQLEHALGRLGENEHDTDDPTVTALIDTLEQHDRKQAAQWRRWLEPATLQRDLRRAERGRVGTVAEQRKAYDAWVEQQLDRLDAATRGHTQSAEGRRARAKGARNAAEAHEAAMSPREFFRANAATIRKNASREALEWLADNPPWTFDEWRYHELGHRDRKAAAAVERRSGYLSEFG